jgi:hypothetical protein
VHCAIRGLAARPRHRRLFFEVSSSRRLGWGVVRFTAAKGACQTSKLNCHCTGLPTIAPAVPCRAVPLTPPFRFFYEGQLLNGVGIDAASKGAPFHKRLAYQPFVSAAALQGVLGCAWCTAGVCWARSCNHGAGCTCCWLQLQLPALQAAVQIVSLIGGL